MKLYNSIGPNPRLVRIFMAEKGIEAEKVEVDLMGAENRQAPYTDKNPAGQLPCLELDDGTVIAETTVICDYLEELKPEPALIGTTPEERAITRMWTRRAEHKFIFPATEAFRAVEGQPLFQNRCRTFPTVGDELKAHAAEGLSWLDEQLAGKDYLVGDRFSLADIALFAFLEFAAAVGQKADPSLKNVATWFDRVGSRSSTDSSV